MKFKVIISFFAICIGSIIYYTFPFAISEKNIEIKCKYMAYACGDCYPQYKIEEVLKGNVNKELINSEINIEFKNTQTEKEINEKTEKCVICYDFYFSGQLKKSGNKGTYLLADKADVKLRFKGCCN